MYHHLQCDLFLYNHYHRVYSGNGRAYRKPKISELIKAQLQRGDLWEALLFQWLDTRGLLLHVQGCVLNGSDIQVCLCQNF